MLVGVIHLALTDLSLNEVELRYWRINPNEYTPRTLPATEIADLAAKVESDYYTIGEQDLIAIGKRLYRWLDGTDRWLAREFAVIGGGPVALLIEAASRLAHLPWEILHDGTTFLVHGSNPAVLPVRWRRTAPHPTVTRNRPLNVLFMATSPQGVKPDLNYEEEESQILQATRTYPLSLIVEETGTLSELGDLVKGYPEDYFDVLHLTGHADHHPDGPRFLTESATGDPEWVSAEQIAEAVPHRPALTFLSGCRTAQSPTGGAVPSLAEALLDRGFQAVLGWGRPVFDGDAIIAAAGLYDRLAAGFRPVEAVLHAHAAMRKAKAKHWHLLRLFVAGEVPDAPVTAPRTPGRGFSAPVTHTPRFIGKQQNVGGKVVDRKDFVGRRRPLQRFIRALRGNDRLVGAVVYGLGGVGKSSLACRICDRLGEAFEPVIHIGVLDEPRLLRSLDQLPDMAGAQRATLQGSGDPLQYRFRALLDLRAQRGAKPILLVLDDFEQNTPLQDGLPLIQPTAQTVLEALVWAIEQTPVARCRCLITSRYKLTTTQGPLFFQEELSALRQTEAEKKRRGLAAYVKSTADIRKRVDVVADGNPRLMEQLDRVLGQPSLDHDALLKKLEQVENAFREQVLARELVAGLPQPTRQLLAGMLVYLLPVPLPAVTPLFPDRSEGEVRAGLEAAAALGLVEDEPAPGGAVYRVPRLLEPILVPDQPADEKPLVDAATTALFRLWWESDYPVTEAEALEIVRLGQSARRADVVVPIADTIGRRWLASHRYQEADVLYREAITAVGSAFELVGGLGRAAIVLGDGEAAERLLREAVAACPPERDLELAYFLYYLAEVLIRRGQPDEALRRLRFELLPIQ
jgi:tetratricopeptide (TPR) repeat protein